MNMKGETAAEFFYVFFNLLFSTMMFRIVFILRMFKIYTIRKIVSCTMMNY